MTRFDATFRDYVAPTGWRLSRALRTLEVSTEPFDFANNPGADGYSYRRTLSINPAPVIWSVPIIAAHELAHILLGHTEFMQALAVNGLPATAVPFAQFELEAHMVAKAVAFGLELTEGDFPRQRVQDYIDSARTEAPEPTVADAVRMARVTLQILEAGMPAVIDAEAIG